MDVPYLRYDRFNNLWNGRLLYSLFLSLKCIKYVAPARLRRERIDLKSFFVLILAEFETTKVNCSKLWRHQWRLGRFASPYPYLRLFNVVTVIDLRANAGNIISRILHSAPHLLITSLRLRNSILTFYCKYVFIFITLGAKEKNQNQFVFLIHIYCIM